MCIFQLLLVDFPDARACQLSWQVSNAFITVMSSLYRGEKNGEINGIIA